MSGASIFVDTNILVYAYDSSAGEKHRIAQKELSDLWASGQGLISIQVLQEFYVSIKKKVPRPVDPEQAKEIIRDLLQWKVIVNDGQAILEAIEIQQRLRFAFWDALIVQAAIKGGAGVLLSEDLEQGRRILGMTIRNPFKNQD
jgi:predicted nucleic acid-binding protein